MSDEIGPVIQRLRSEQWSGEPGRGWRTYRLRVEEIGTGSSALLSDAVNGWLGSHLGVVVVSIQYQAAVNAVGDVWSSALILYREGVPADGAGSE